MNATVLQKFLSRSASQATRSEIRELLKLMARPEIISLAGGMPSPDAFPIDKLAELLPADLRDHGRIALQYGPTEGKGDELALAEAYGKYDDELTKLQRRLGATARRYGREESLAGGRPLGVPAIRLAAHFRP